MGHFPIFFLQISNPPCFPGVGVVGVSDDKCITTRGTLTNFIYTVDSFIVSKPFKLKYIIK